VLTRSFRLDYGRAAEVFFAPPYAAINERWALFEGQEIVSILAVTPLEFGWGSAVGIAGVATVRDRRGEGHATRLMERVLSHLESQGRRAALLFAAETTLYDRMGFEPIDRVVRAPIDIGDPAIDAPTLPFETVRATYDKWSQAHPDRLRRDEPRWDYWRWHYRDCLACGGGYVCDENGTVREALVHRSEPRWPLSPEAEWFGTTAMADQLGLVFRSAREELRLLGRNVPGVPQLFLTDQF